MSELELSQHGCPLLASRTSHLGMVPYPGYHLFTYRTNSLCRYCDTPTTRPPVLLSLYDICSVDGGWSQQGVPTSHYPLLFAWFHPTPSWFPPFFLRLSMGFPASSGPEYRRWCCNSLSKLLE